MDFLVTNFKLINILLILYVFLFHFLVLGLHLVHLVIEVGHLLLEIGLHLLGLALQRLVGRVDLLDLAQSSLVLDFGLPAGLNRTALLTHNQL